MRLLRLFLSAITLGASERSRAHRAIRALKGNLPTIEDERAKVSAELRESCRRLSEEAADLTRVNDQTVRLDVNDPRMAELIASSRNGSDG